MCKGPGPTAQTTLDHLAATIYTRPQTSGVAQHPHPATLDVNRAIVSYLLVLLVPGRTGTETIDIFTNERMPGISALGTCSRHWQVQWRTCTTQWKASTARRGRQERIEEAWRGSAGQPRCVHAVPEGTWSN
ncbi:hypothetical protein EDB85DRAFT_1901785 [Lactarius pseudohatsudake]|nr:hypothetical protein EDB85DRAFT_1901785 [Lactarius pseudohatsudake]